MIRYLLFLILSISFIALHSQDTKFISTDDTTYLFSDPGFELLDAAAIGDTNKINAFLKIGTDVNTTTWEGVTPLMFAAQNGHLSAVEILIDNGADVNAKPYSQMDALILASIAGHVHIADTLILNGANINTKNLDGITPLMYAAAFDHQLLCDVLLFYGARINESDDYNNFALHYASFYGNLEIVQLLIESGAEMESKDEDGFTPFMIAAQNGHIEVLGYLYEIGSDITATNNYGHTALALAVYNQQYESAEFLLSIGADPNFVITPKVKLYELAIETKGKEMAELLISYGATPRKSTSFNKLILNYDLNWNSDDLMMGGSLGLMESKTGLIIQAGYATRPAVRSILLESGPNTWYQLWEKRSVIFTGLEKQFVLYRPDVKEQWGAFFSLNGCYNYGSYRGSNQKPDAFISVIPKAGIFGNYDIVNFKMNYEYMKLKGSAVSSHRISFSLGLKINLLKSKIPLKPEPYL